MAEKADSMERAKRGRSERGRQERERGTRRQERRPATEPAETQAAASLKQGSDAAVLELDNFLPYRLSVLNNLVSRALASQYQARFGLSIPEWRVMANLGRAAPLSANEVAERTSMDKVKVSRAISRMQTAGLVKRETDARDNRVSSLKLSAKGKRIYDKIAPMALAWEREFLSVLSEKEITAFDKILEKLDKRIRE
ncbi:MarR family winged helix-turn-helix transcriptional regulator [Pelagibius sp. Alg239-R121]|uniref:MarR family winged helix-turn-helix transcriptional regulator n=1 Tax=Pelagibius sp. Alg239-R121 TaxID=2993448 RepID=UPI0024A62006|nr:MarR family winged helix-turn-helix transcriptional regulator [Pelagibius sp. Alg239-R121]